MDPAEKSNPYFVRQEDFETENSDHLSEINEETGYGLYTFNFLRQPSKVSPTLQHTAQNSPQGSTPVRRPSPLHMLRTLFSQRRPPKVSPTPQHTAQNSRQGSTPVPSQEDADDDLWDIPILPLSKGKHKVRNEEKIYEYNECPVCYGDLSAPRMSSVSRKLEWGVSVFPCGHRLHSECAQDVLQSEREHLCPICRKQTNDNAIPLEEWDNNFPLFSRCHVHLP